MPSLPHAILTAEHVHPNVRTAADYRRRQRQHIAKGRALYPNLVWPAPWMSLAPPLAVIITQGQWKVMCRTLACLDAHDHPSLSRACRLAICLNCGAIYEDVQIPDEADEIERLLLLRSDIQTRNWVQGETVDDLRRENAEHEIVEAA